MKKVSIFGLIVAVVSFMSLPVAFGYSIYVNDLVQISNGMGSTGGGEFGVSKINPPAQDNMFTTFCLETNEYVEFGVTFRVDGLDEYAVAGGSGGSHPDPLDARTAYLYYHFAMGSLANYNNDIASADALQKAIWFIEQENGGENNFFVAQAQAAINAGEWSGLANVRVMNLVFDESVQQTGTTNPLTREVNKQSLLTLVPEPLTILLLGLGLVGLAGLRRAEKKRD
jgi:hypothetical protein